MKNSHWRARAAPLIAGVLAQFPPGNQRRLALRAAYPFGERRGWPYTAWRLEIHAQEIHRIRTRQDPAPPLPDRELLP